MSLTIIKSIREKTGLSLKDIKKAVEANPGITEAEIIENLRKQGVLKQQSREDRQATNGKIFSYVHEGRIGVLLEVKSETDFVSNSEAFVEFGNDVCLHIAAYTPKFISEKDIDQSFVDKELEIAKSQLEQEGKPAEIIEKILLGKKSKVLEEYTLLGQSFLKDPERKVGDYLSQLMQATGEKIEITRFKVFILS